MSLNKAIIMGRITKDLELKQTTTGKAYVRFVVAVDRYSKSEENQADFISCVAWNKTAEFICNYFGKGRMIALEGSINTGSYEDNNGTRHYTTDIVVSNVSFTGEKSSDDYSGGGQQPSSGYNNSAPQSNTAQNNASNTSTIGSLSDFEEVISDDGVPF